MKNSAKKFFTKRNIIIGIVLIVLVLLGFFAFRGGNNKEQLLTVIPGEFVQEVSISGQVVPAESVDLTFPESGRITSVPAKVGSTALIGQTLVTLESSSLVAELRSAEAELARRRAQTGSNVTSLEKVTQEQNTLVKNAYQKLLSEGLEAVPTDRNSTLTPPIITGLYQGEAGTYRIRIKRALTSTPNNFELIVNGIESVPTVRIQPNEATRLGTKGLFVSFPDELAAYDDTTWTIVIPNTKSTSYLANYQAFQEAERSRDRAIAEASASLEQSTNGLTVAQADILQAQADVMRLQSEIANRTLRAPFSGIITKVDAKVGGIVSGGQTAVSLISADKLQIESYVAEINIPFIEVGDTAAVTLDAYGDDLPLTATVIAIDPAETIRDGVSTYRVKLEFSSEDPRIKSGMTANVVITAEEKNDVISVPVGIVTNRDGKKYVPVKEGDKTVDREVKVGPVSSLGMIEITSGLNPGDVVVTTPQ